MGNDVALATVSVVITRNRFGKARESKQIMTIGDMLSLFKHFYFQRTRFDSYHARFTLVGLVETRVGGFDVSGGGSLVTSRGTHFGKVMVLAAKTEDTKNYQGAPMSSRIQT